jgi:uncharacterized protein (TIGR02996 family)
MTPATGFLRAMQDDDDDTSRLIFADWLQERGDAVSAARAELIRVQCELARWVPDLERRTELQQREQELIAEHGLDWLGPLEDYCLSWRFERGLAWIQMEASRFVGRSFAARAPELLRQAYVGAVRLEGAAHAQRTLPTAAHLEEVSELDLSYNGLSDEFVDELVKSSHLDQLRTLNLSNNALTDASLWLGVSPSLRRLRRRILRNNAIIGEGRAAVTLWDLGPAINRIDLHGNLLTTFAHATVSHQQNGLVWNVPGRPPRLFNSIGMQLALIPAGTFLRGAPPDEKGSFANEKPQHAVTLSRPFYLGLYPVTQRDYLTVMGSNPSHFTAQHNWPNYPVEEVRWEDTVTFCEQLSALPDERAAGRVYRLPTEAEWEYACRAGTTTAFSFGPTASSTQANFSGQHPYDDADGPYLQRTSIVGSYLPNAFGLYDMHGNVWEWCSDWYQPDYYARSPAVDPPGPESGEGHPLRGGSWFIVGRGCRSAERCYTDEAPVRRTGSVGFRVAMTLR